LPLFDSEFEHVFGLMFSLLDEFGKYSYERRRARAMTLMMRYARLRISDVVTLAREHIKGQYLVKRQSRTAS
jgi:hypothetical protein